jgi:epoxyqueuosine reductase
MEWESRLQKYCELAKALQIGMTQLTTPLSWLHYEKWIQNNFQVDMHYLKTHAESKKDPSSWQPLMKSALVFAFPYLPHPKGNSPLPASRVALYAAGEDYHHWMKDQMNEVVKDLQIHFPTAQFSVHTDSSPILERDLAQRAGLGWFGKNTCLIHPKKGSLFLIGEILTSLDCTLQTEPVHDFCGTCTKCLEVCPTKALVSPKVLKPELCISYWTIESRKIAPVELRKQMGDWLFGCDLCQTVCPWNQKAFQKTLKFDLQLQLNPEESQNQIDELRWLLTSSHREILKKVKGTPLSRAGGKGLKRNALIVIANRKIDVLKPQVEQLANDPYLGELARWTADQLS